MATHARFGILNADGSVDSVYVHSDGYPFFLESKLRESYDTEEKIRELMKGGDLSSIYSSHTNPPSPERLDRIYNRPQHKSENLEEYLSDASACCFAYYFSDGEWHRHVFCDGHPEWELTVRH